MSPQATDAEIRRAYRALARRHHPDRNGTGDGTDMARINAAYRVLGTPERRAVYDERRRKPAVHARTPEQRAAERRAPAAAAAWTFVERRVPVEPARFPWRFFAVLAGLAITAGLALAVLHEPDAEAPVHDQIIEAGSCVFVQGTGRVVEVTCGSPNSRTVATVVTRDESCAPGLLRYRTIDPDVNACVERAR